MKVEAHPHAQDRSREPGATEEGVIATVQQGERFPTKHRRHGFGANFPFDGEWNGTAYSTKQIEACAVEEDSAWLVITVINKFY